MAISKKTITRLILRKPLAWRESLLAEAEAVGLGMTTSISSLGSSSTYSMEDAETILEALMDVEDLESAAPLDGTGPSPAYQPQPLGHVQRFQPVCAPEFTVWGP